MTKSITIKRPDDWHLHLRDGAMLEGVLPHTAKSFARAIAMPNLMPPVITGDDAKAYHDRILAALPEGLSFKPLMTLYLTEDTDADDVAAAYEAGIIAAVKLYPAGATTNSQDGVRDLDKVTNVLERMAAAGIPLCIHGEVTDEDVDIFDREAVFVDRVLDPLRQRLPELKIVLEHLTTKHSVDYLMASEKNLAATITCHHLLINRNDMLDSGMRPHYFCFPVVKSEQDRLALVKAATSGDKRFFAGTDSAPHPTPAKERACGNAGIFSAPNALSCYAHVFEQENALDKLEGFASLYGPAYYGLPVNEAEITLVKQDEPVDFPAQIETGAGPVTVFDPGFDLFWKLQ